MNLRVQIAGLLLIATFHIVQAQETPIDDWKPAATNQDGKEFPQVNSEGRVRFRVHAPDAKSVACTFRESSEFIKDDTGNWTGYTRKLDEGFHYYELIIDGAHVPDPNSKYYFGAMRWGSGVEIPAHDRDFYALKKVPHGQIRDVLFFSESTQQDRRAFIYTPPGYDQNQELRYPVLYLQHGWGENEYGWSVQGHAGLILDNLIAEDNVEPFIVVMTYGMTNDVRMGGMPNFDIKHFETVLVDELVPYVDDNFRTLSDQPNRAMAGLSMGSMETKSITMRNLDKFSHIGLFSGATISKQDVESTEGFSDKVKLVFVSYGSKEVGGDRARRGGDPAATVNELKELGINAHYYLSPETAHEWQTWRRSLNEFVPLLFQPTDKLTGSWKATFATRLGNQEYTFSFNRVGQKITGRAQVEAGERSRNVELRDVELDGQTLSFWEPLDLGGNEIRIEFNGEITNDSISITRKVGDLSNETVVATRASMTEPMEDGFGGIWHSRFETPFGTQTYHLHFAINDDGSATAKAEVESSDDKRNVEFTDVKTDGDTISFVEVQKFGEREMRIGYTGKLEGQKLVLIRSFGNREGQELLATRTLPDPLPEPDTTPVVEVKIERVIKEAFQNSFLVGMAGDVPARYSDQELALAAEHFNAVTPENCMKPERIHPQEGSWNFAPADALVDWATQNKMTAHGHTLVWHQQTPDWFFSGSDKDVVMQRMKDHVETIVGRYQGKLQSWDVVNEAINDGGNAETAQTENLRDSKWLQILGQDFLRLAFEFAHAADPEAILYYNDYNIESGPKHESSMVLLKRLLDAGAPVHAVGIQGHWRSGSVPFEDIDRAITNYASLGLKVSITELDVTIRGAAGGQFGQGGGGRRSRGATPATVDDLNQQADDYAKLFAIFKKHEDVIERVTFWGLNDRRTWRFGQHPLLFDANNNPKPAYAAIVNDAGRDASQSNAVSPNRVLVIEDGGTGQHSAIITENRNLPGITIYRPGDLTALADQQQLPVILWGNGACANTSEEHKNFLNEIASHGYVILAIGPFDQVENRDEAARNRTESSQLLQALDWIVAEYQRSDSDLFGKVDLSKDAAMGMSCGGMQAIEVSFDSRITTTIVCNSGVLPEASPMPAMPALKKEDLEKLHGPVLYIMGGPSDIAYNNAMDDYSRINHVPIAMTNLDVGHAGTYRQPHGGKYAPVAIAWLDWQLKGQKDASETFLGDNSKLKRDANWTIESKNLLGR